MRLERVGMVDVTSMGVGESSVVVDFHIPGLHPSVERRGIASSMRLDAPFEFSRLTLRYPTLRPPGNSSSTAQRLAEAVAVGVMNNPDTRYGDERIPIGADEAAVDVRALGRVPSLGTMASIGFELFPANDNGTNLHLTLDSSGLPPDETVDPMTVVGLIDGAVEAFYNELEES